MTRLALASLALLAACGAVDPGSPDGGAAPDGGLPPDPRRFAARVVSFTPGEGAGFGQDKLPDVVLGPPKGRGETAGSLDVLSLGKGGAIVLGFDDDIVDGDGPDLIVFENAFHGLNGQEFVETGRVAVSEDGVEFHEFPCATDDATHRFPGCAGTSPVLSSPDDGISPFDPATAGGNAFDLHDLGVTRARFVRITDSGENSYLAPSGGFDLDAVSIVNAAEPAP